MIARVAIAALAAPLCGATLAVAGVPAAVPGAAVTCAAATAAHHVAVVVQHGDGRIVRGCAGFDTASVNGVTALQTSGLEVATVAYGPLGAAVCQLDNEPATYPPTCWTSTSPYWVLFVAHSGGAWRVASTGLSSQELHDGDAIGFRYDAQTGSDPPPAAPAVACTTAAAAASPAGADAAAVTPSGGGISAGIVVAIAGVVVLLAALAVSLRRRARQT